MAKKQEADCLMSMLEVPVTRDPPPSEFVIHIDTKLSVAQSTILRRITRELDCQGATLASGRRVTDNAQAFKWLLEKIEASLA